MAVLSVVVMACLVVISVTADTLNPQPLPLPLLLDQGRREPHYIIKETLNPEILRNSVREQDLRASEEFDEGGSEADVPGPLRLSSPYGKLPSDTQVHVPREAAILTRLTSSDLLEEEGASNRMLWSPSRQMRMYGAITPRRKDSKKGHKRQKRYTLKYKLRSIAVPLSVFNFLGFLPVRVPGLPYHNDLPSPDYSRYNTKHDVFVPRYRRRKTFRRFWKVFCQTCCWISLLGRQAPPRVYTIPRNGSDACNKRL